MALAHLSSDFSETLILTTPRLVIRLPEERDVPAVLRYYRENRSFLAPYEPLRPEGFFSEEFWHAQVDRTHSDFRDDRACRFFLFDREDNRTALGYASFTGITRGAAHFSYLGYSLAERAQGRGLMYEALQKAIGYAFSERSLHRVMANYMPHNLRSGRLLRRLGFIVEGYARDYLLINGRWEDHILTSLTNRDWSGEKEWHPT